MIVKPMANLRDEVKYCISYWKVLLRILMGGLSNMIGAIHTNDLYNLKGLGLKVVNTYNWLEMTSD